MNTSHNKNRIIEKGWKNVLKNIFNHPIFGYFTKEESEAISSNTEEKVVTTDKPESLQISKKKDIFEISSTVTDKKSTLVQNYSLEDVPCSSNENWMKNSLDKKIDKEVPILDIKKLGKQKYIECLSHKLVINLENNLEDEKVYLERFKILIKFTENCKQGKILSEKELEIDSTIAFTCNKEILKGKSKMKQNKISSKPKLSSYCDDKDSNEITQDNGSARYLSNTNIKESVSRSKKRKEMVVKLLKSCKENDKFCRILDQIIDMEENFVVENSNLL